MAKEIAEIHPTLKLGFSAEILVRGIRAGVIEDSDGHFILLLPVGALDRFRIKDHIIAHELIHLIHKADLLQGVIPSHRALIQVIDRKWAMVPAHPSRRLGYHYHMEAEEFEAFHFQLKSMMEHQNDADAVQNDFYAKNFTQEFNGIKYTVAPEITRIVQRVITHMTLVYEKTSPNEDWEVLRTHSRYPGIDLVTFEFPTVNIRFRTYVYSSDPRKPGQIFEDEVAHLYDLALSFQESFWKTHLDEPAVPKDSGLLISSPMTDSRFFY